MILCNKRITNALIRLRVCAGRSAPLLFPNILASRPICYYDQYVQLTLFRPMECSIKLQTIQSGWSIVFLRGNMLFLKNVFFKTDFVLANRPDPDEMPHDAAFHLSLHCLQK